MTEQVVTRVLPFGEGNGVSGHFVVALDDERNRDGEQAKTSFAAGDVVYLLVHHEPGLVVKRTAESAGGGLSYVGVVSRLQSQEIHVTGELAGIDLPHIPDGLVTVRWYGRAGHLLLNGRQLQPQIAHVTGLVTYRYSAHQYRYHPPAGMTLAAGDDWPVDVDFEYVEVEG